MDYIKWLNRIALIIFIIFLVWYYLPENREIRGKDPCSYYAIKENVTCKCIPIKAGYVGVTTFFYPNGSVNKDIPLQREEVLFNVTR